MTLEQLVNQLKQAHGDALHGVVVYGSTATRADAKSGHNVLVVVSSLGLTAMHASGAIGRAWQQAGNAVPLTLTDAEWRSSADVFAIEHADIADRHRVLFAAAGFDVTARGAVREADIRRQLEYELLALVLAVRSGIVAAGTNVADRRGQLASHASQAMALIRAAVRLSGAAPLPDTVALAAQGAALGGFDAAPFVAAQRQRHGEGDVPKAELDTVLAGFHGGLCALLAYVDSKHQ